MVRLAKFPLSVAPARRKLRPAEASDPVVPDTISVNTARCTWETIDGETMVIDTNSGELFALRGLAASVWDSLVGGQATAQSLAAEAGRRYGARAHDDLAVLLGVLIDAQLLVPCALATEAEPAWPGVYEQPTLDRFDDIADILTLDPIHDVEPSAGWPYPHGGEKA